MGKGNTPVFSKESWLFIFVNKGRQTVVRGRQPPGLTDEKLFNCRSPFGRETSGVEIERQQSQKKICWGIARRWRERKVTYELLKFVTPSLPRGKMESTFLHKNECFIFHHICSYRKFLLGFSISAPCLKG